MASTGTGDRMSLGSVPDWFENFYKELYPKLFRYALRFIEASKADEIVQDSFVKLLDQPDNKEPNHMTSWLYVTCRNQCIDEIRRRRKMKSSEDIDEDLLVDQTDHLDDQIYQNQINEQLKSALAVLTFKEKEVIRLKFQDGLSYQQISEITGHNVNYVGVLIHESVQKIKGQVLTLNQKGVQNGKK
jgi:RNA polymerase sigma factor (sigma-70 family)